MRCISPAIYAGFLFVYVGVSMSISFESLGLRPELVQAVSELGFEQATPIQTNAIPALLEGRDVIGQAQTGTGKTAAFALPMLQMLDPRVRGVQGLVLVPTRELALQVSEAIHGYGRLLRVSVLAIYGGSSYIRQIKRLEQGVHIVVGTPGRLIDLIERGVLDLSTVSSLVLDEADEMLKMGFVDDVERILRETPAERRTALFSATMPSAIRRLADRYLRNPQMVAIETKARTVAETEQRYYMVHESSKLAALARLIETEDITSALIFARTKLRTSELAEQLLARGFYAEALNGDLSQDARETVLRRFRNGQVVFLVATDVVARGVDIPTVSHVINYDMPQDSEDYVHRIGRTGRAGREGVAITLVTPREGRGLHMIEDYTRQKIARATLPAAEAVLARRDERFLAGLAEQLDDTELERELNLVGELVRAGYDVNEVAAAAIRMARAGELQRPIEDVRDMYERTERSFSPRDRSEGYGGGARGRTREQEPGMVRLMIDMGREHGIRPGDIVGAIASEAGIPGKSIGAIDIQRTQTFVDVKETHADRVLSSMGRGMLRGRPITLTRAGGSGSYNNRAPRRARTTEHA
jgi:ATP-dependent RNA helicase DeaD